MVYQNSNVFNSNMNNSNINGDSSNVVTCIQNQKVQQYLETLQVMKRQEESSAYSLYSSNNKDLYRGIPGSTRIDLYCRSAMMKWCYEVTDACQYSKETVLIAMDCLDRFLSTSLGQETLLYDRNKFQLASMTAMYFAVKSHECSVMDVNLVARLSHNQHTTKDIESMERIMLSSLQWRVNPPTVYSYARTMIELLSNTNANLFDSTEMETILEMTMLQLDVLYKTSCDQHNQGCVVDDVDDAAGNSNGNTDSYALSSTTKSSCLALGALLNAVESVLAPKQHYVGVFGFRVGFCQFETLLMNLLKVDRQQLNHVRIALYEAINGGGKKNGGLVCCSSLDDADDNDVDVVAAGGGCVTAGTTDDNDAMDIDDDDNIIVEDNNNGFANGNATANDDRQQQQQKQQKQRTARTTSPATTAIYYDSPKSCSPRLSAAQA